MARKFRPASGFGGGLGQAAINRPGSYGKYPKARGTLFPKTGPGWKGADQNPFEGEIGMNRGMDALQPYHSFEPTSHPRYQQILAQMNAMGEADLANSRAAIQQALIGFGATPEGFNDQFGSLDDNTRALIEKNTKGGLSTVAQLNEQRTDAITGLVNKLSATGMRRSGAKGAGLRRRQKDYDRAYAASLQKLLQMANGLYGQYAENQMNRNMSLQDLYWQIGDNYGYAPYQDPWSLSPGGGGSGDSGLRPKPGPNDPPQHPWRPKGGSGGKRWVE